MNIKVRPAFRCPQKKPGALAAQVGDFRLPGLERTAFVRVFVRALTRRMSGFLGFEIDKDASLAIIATLPSPCVHGWPSGAQLLPRCREPGQARGTSTKFQPPATLRIGVRLPVRPRGAESLTNIAPTHAPDHVYDEARRQFSKELADLSIVITTFWVQQRAEKSGLVGTVGIPHEHQDAIGESLTEHLLRNIIRHPLRRSRCALHGWLRHATRVPTPAAVR
jgi:hypothetical protein